MTTDVEVMPWDKLQALTASGDSEGLEPYINWMGLLRHFAL
jgi:hypothetical protein